MAEKERSVVALQQTSLLLRGFWRKRDSPYSENGRVYSHSGACNGEFGGVAVSRNQVMIVQKSLCLVVFSVKAQNELSDLKYTFLVVANNNKMIDYLSKRTIKLF